jgi:hypothetical protein
MKVSKKYIDTIIDCFKAGYCPTCHNKPPYGEWCITCCRATVKKGIVGRKDLVEANLHLKDFV